MPETHSRLTLAAPWNGPPTFLGALDPRAAAIPAAAFPLQPLHHLDALWIQVAGTLCNLACRHCFVPSGPGIERHRMLPRPRVLELVSEGLALGVREIYFTGGEPFLHPEMIGILGDTLQHAPCTVLTNGTLFSARRVADLAELAARAHWSLEIRVSLDGLSAAEHDAVRGRGTFERTLAGLQALERRGLLPIVTLTQQSPEDPLVLIERARVRLAAAGLERPRLKVLPLFRLGREAERHGPYRADETLAGLAPEDFDPLRLPCGSCRAVTSEGVFACPLLVDEPAARLGARLAEGRGAVELRHGACLTCWVTGSTCGNGG